MYYELALISVAIAGGYWGWFFVRQDATRLYGVMLMASAILSCLGLLGRKDDIASLGTPGAIGVGAGTCLLVVGPLVRGLARRAAGAERFGIADKLLTIADVLAPGSGVPDEKALLGAMREIRDGNIEHTVQALTSARHRAPEEAKLAIDERIAMLYLASYRWNDAIAHAEAHLFGAVPPADTGPHVGLRNALGISPPVWVELLGAYGYTGDLDRAAHMLARLEEVCAGREDAAIWLHRGRMMFLALAGRPQAVRTLVEPRRSRHMSPGARNYWVAVALERHGDARAAEAAYAKARSKSRGRPRVLIDQALARLPTAHEVSLGDAAREIVDRVEAAPPPPVVARVRTHTMLATRLLSAACVVSALAIALFVGTATDVGVLLRGGALVRGLTHAEPWRLVSCIFVHVGSVHLIVNLLGLWFLGRLAEELFGGWKLAAIFALSGIAGSFASWLASPAGISAGASGAIFGILGALLVELTWQRRRHRVAWSRGIWGSLALVTVAQVGIGFFYPVTDQWAHAGGLFTGALLGFAMSPHVRLSSVMQQVSRVIALAFAFAVIASAVLVARTSIADSLSRGPIADHRVGGVTVSAPASWTAKDDELADPDQLIAFVVGRGSIDDVVSHELAHSHELGFSQSRRATETLVPLPAGWHGVELELTATDALGADQHFRLVVAGRDDGVVVSLYLPVTLAAAAPAYFTALFDSVR
jgi:membrane associated rhomboid family serine protease